MRQEIEPIVRTVTVPGSTERAFHVFTQQMGTWWPLDTHSIAVDQELGQRAETLKVDAREGGRIEEVLEDGSTRDWGGIVLWEPPLRVVYAWKPNDNPTPSTEVDVRFAPSGDGTRVEVEHRGWEGLGDWSERIHPLYASEGGWTLVLERFRSAAESEAGTEGRSTSQRGSPPGPGPEMP
jgi:uncharacterized protein YndB with AHSA1/START domain